MSEPNWSSGSNYQNNRSAVDEYWNDRSKREQRRDTGLTNLVKGYNVFKTGLQNTEHGNTGIDVARKYSAMDDVEWTDRMVDGDLIKGEVPEWLRSQHTKDTLSVLADGTKVADKGFMKGGDTLFATGRQGISPDARVTDVQQLGKTASEMGTAEATQVGLKEMGASVASNPYAMVALLIAGLAGGSNKKGSTLNRWLK
jgi:hypothetical protein